MLERFPMEILCEILRCCDPKTLLSLSRCSSGFSNLSVPILYRQDVTDEDCYSVQWVMQKRRKRHVMHHVLMQATSNGACLTAAYNWQFWTKEQEFVPSAILPQTTTILAYAIWKRREEAVQCLLSIVPPDARPGLLIDSFLPLFPSFTGGGSVHRNITALHVAAFMGFPKLATDLLAYGVDVDAPDEKGCSPLAYSIFSPFESCKTMTALMAGGADEKKPFGEPRIPPLIHACQRGKLLLATSMLLRGSARMYDPRITTDALAHVLEGTSRRARPSKLKQYLIRLLVQSGADPNAWVSREGLRPLPLLLDIGLFHPKAFECFLEVERLDINQTDSEDRTILCQMLDEASSTAHYQCIGLLLARGAKVDAQSRLRIITVLKSQTTLYPLGFRGDLFILYLIDGMMSRASPPMEEMLTAAPAYLKKVVQTLRATGKPLNRRTIEDYSTM
ncbi:hypothetical protein S40288_11737 [Stachybotrys chartarum IBT 40288]|nr:hypothetical protein S40288_11737 [Stachybotrys chartarum IBT 40288]